MTLLEELKAIDPDLIVVTNSYGLVCSYYRWAGYGDKEDFETPIYVSEHWDKIKQAMPDVYERIEKEGSYWSWSVILVKYNPKL